MAKFIDITGKKYNRLTVIKRLENTDSGAARWLCKCDCGNETIVRGCNLKNGAVKSCGCLLHKPKPTKHGMCKTELYARWAAMKSRCSSKNKRTYKDYAGRGITVCEEWLAFEPFVKWALSNGYKKGLTLERINNDLGYSPANCKWITLGEQANNRRSSRLFTYNGKTMTLVQWCKEFDVDYRLAHNRINKLTWDFERAITEPCNINKRNHTSKER